jgi:hypothetical protein
VDSNSTSVFWCSTDRIFAGLYALCNQTCPLLARNLIKPSDGPNVIHSSCLHASSSVNITSLFPTPTQQQLIVDVHNQIRSSVGNASDLRVVSWDFDVARLAQRKAETCVLAHDCFNCRRLVNNNTITIGQNAFAMFYSYVPTLTGYYYIIERIQIATNRTQ